MTRPPITEANLVDFLLQTATIKGDVEKETHRHNAPSQAKKSTILIQKLYVYNNCDKHPFLLM